VAVVASLAVVVVALGLFNRDSAFLSLATTSSYTSVVLVSRLAIVGLYSGPSAVNSASILISSLGSADFLRLAISLWMRVRVDAAPSIVSMGPSLNLMNSANRLLIFALSSLWCILLSVVHTLLGILHAHHVAELAFGQGSLEDACSDGVVLVPYP
jgi:hypothetical protein